MGTILTTRKKGQQCPFFFCGLKDEKTRGQLRFAYFVESFDFAGGEGGGKEGELVDGSVEITDREVGVFIVRSAPVSERGCANRDVRDDGLGEDLFLAHLFAVEVVSDGFGKAVVDGGNLEPFPTLDRGPDRGREGNVVVGACDFTLLKREKEAPVVHDLPSWLIGFVTVGEEE